jgi:hypothetical protein
MRGKTRRFASRFSRLLNRATQSIAELVRVGRPDLIGHRWDVESDPEDECGRQPTAKVNPAKKPAKGTKSKADEQTTAKGKAAKKPAKKYEAGEQRKKENGSSFSYSNFFADIINYQPPQLQSYLRMSSGHP